MKILIIENRSELSCRVVSALGGFPDVEVVDTARHLRDGLQIVQSRHMDAVILGSVVPETGTTEFLQRLRAIERHLPVILFAPPKFRPGTAVLSALSAGASAQVKYQPDASPEILKQCVAEQLLPTIRRWYETTRSVRERQLPAERSSWKAKAVAAVKAKHRVEQATNAPVPGPRPARKIDGVVVIGSSTGGIQALQKVLAPLPASLIRPVLVVQHLLDGFGTVLVQGLRKHTSLPVSEAAEGDELQQGHVYVAPPGRHMKVKAQSNGRIAIRLSADPPENSCRPAADVLFRSAAAVYGSHTLGVVLSGMGRDGTEGSRCISSRGGQILVQRKDSCVVWGMPRSVHEAGLADCSLTPEALGQRVAAANSRADSRPHAVAASSRIL